MKNFWTGLITLFIYATACILIVGYFFLNNTISHEESTDKDAITLSIEPENVETRKTPSNKTLDTSKIKDSTSSPQSHDIAPHKSKTDLSITETAASYSAKPFVVYGIDKNVLVDCKYYSKIYKNQAKVKIPYYCINYGLQLKEYLASQPRAQLQITGYHDKSETADLGVQRAQYIKKLLVNTGIPELKIQVNSAFQNIPFKNGVADGGITMSIRKVTEEAKTTTPLTSTNTEVIEAQPEINPYSYRRFSSGFKDDKFYGDPSFTSYINKIQKYLRDHSDLKIYVYAHSEVDLIEDAMRITRMNTETVKNNMIQDGIRSDLVKTVPLGNQPVGSLGRKKCIIIVVK